MQSHNIIYIKPYKILQHPELMDVLEQYPQYDWQWLKKIHNFKIMPNMTYGRAGKCVFPFKNSGIEKFNLALPKYNPAFDKTFKEVTDEQCHRWLKEKNQRPWIVCWSGGIDSTVIVTSILKNTTPADRENIRILCNRTSVYENPNFFFRHIQPNFKIVDPQLQSVYQLYCDGRSHIIDGNLADQLYCGAIGLEMLETFPSCLDFDCRTNPDILLRYLEIRMDRPFAEWYYEHMMENINSVDIPIETYHDFWWWQFFNYVWSDIVLLQGWDNLEVQQEPLLERYQDSHLFWYGTEEYQQWSMNNNRSKIKCGTDLASTKEPSKQYINEFDHNEYYRAFKTKQESTSLPRYHRHDICTLSDFSLLYDKDLSQVAELLHQHINT